MATHPHSERAALGQLLDHLNEHRRDGVNELTRQAAKISDMMRYLTAQLAEWTSRVAGDDLTVGSARSDEHSRVGEIACASPPSRRTSVPSPDPRLLRRIIRNRQLRSRYLDGGLFADPAWDMLLDLTIARAEYRRVSISSLCIAANVPTSTALRRINNMIAAGIFVRMEDDNDGRRAFVALSENTAVAMAHYFAELGIEAVKSV